MNKKILVTGGTGYIGSHTVVELIEEGFEVVVIDDLSNSSVDVIDRIEKITSVRPVFYELDLCNKEKLFNVISETSDIYGIIHFAASKAVGESVENPLHYYRNNLVSLLNIIEAMKTFDIHHLVFSSSCTVYGQPDKLPVDEKESFKKAESPYGNTKQIGEEILQDVANAHKNLQFIALRYFNPVGAHESGLIGEYPNGVPNNLVPFITQAAAGLRDGLKIFGNDYNTPDGTAVRDYIHVVDVAKAHVKTLVRLLEKKNVSAYEFFNLGSGNGYSVQEVVDAFENATGVQLKYEVVGRRSGDVEKIYADSQSALDKLGWKAEKSLEEMLTSAWKWQKSLST